MEEFLHQALYVENIDEEFDPDTAPSTGQEYLKRVIIEARKCEPIVVASIDTKKLKAQTIRYTNDSGCPQPPSGYAPSLEWQQQQVSRFSEVRNRLAQHSGRMKQGEATISTPTLPDLDKEDLWAAFCFGTVPDSSNGTPPLLPIVLSLNQYTVETLLDYHVRWLEEGKPFSQERGQWLYALLAKLEKPLKPEMCSLLRSLARLCSSQRAKLPSAQDSLLPQMNLFICLVGRYFDQTDLADDEA